MTGPLVLSGRKDQKVNKDGNQHAAGSGDKRRPGRPEGVGLTEEIAQTILTYIRAGAFDYVAAEAAGISDRTFRDWIARGEGRGPRPGTPELVAFAIDVRTARAQVRAAAEIRIFQEHPEYWLAHVARTKEDREGWTEPRRSKGEDMTPERISGLTDEELQEQLDRLQKVMRPTGSTRPGPKGQKRGPNLHKASGG